MPILLNGKRINLKLADQPGSIANVSGECCSDARKKKGDNCQHSSRYPETDNFDPMCRKNVLVRLVARCNFAAIYCGTDIALAIREEPTRRQFRDRGTGDRPACAPAFLSPHEKKIVRKTRVQ